MKILKKNLNYVQLFENIAIGLPIAALISFIINKNSFYIFYSVLTIVTMLSLRTYVKKVNCSINKELYLLVLLFIFLSMFLGKLCNFYSIFPWWDKMLHTLSGLLLSIIALYLYKSLSPKDELEVKNILLIVIFTFCFALAMGALWEIFEFTTDFLFNLNSQNGSLQDTMGDLIADASGALFSSIITYAYIKGYNIKILNKLIRVTDKNNYSIKSSNESLVHHHK